MNQHQTGELGWFDLYVQDLKSVWNGVTDVFSAGAETVTQYQEHKQTFIDIWNEAKQAWDEFLNGRDLDAPTDSGRKRTSLVLSLFAAQNQMEKFRIENLKDTIDEIRSKISDQIELITTRAKSLADGAAAYAGKPSAGGLAAAGAALNELQLAASQVEEILRELLNLAKLFDFLTVIEDDMEAECFGQSNTEANLTKDDWKGRRSRH